MPSLPFSNPKMPRWIAMATLLVLGLIMIGQVILGWRYFPGLLGDQGWNLQVALRVSQGEVLYRDVAWGYGPLSIQILALFMRALGPSAAVPTAISGILALLSLLLIYVCLRALLPVRYALLFTVFSGVAGSHVGGDLFRMHFYVYLQAVAWGSLASLAALAAALAWLRARSQAWLVLAGAATTLAFLFKLEFGPPALAALAVVLLAGRGSLKAWISAILGLVVTAVVGVGWQIGSVGWQAFWRGYTFHDHLSSGRAWGARPASVPWLASVYLLWVPVISIWVGRRWPRWRWLAYGVAGLAVVFLVPLAGRSAVGEPVGSALAKLVSGNWDQINLVPANLLAWLAAAPWAPMVFVLGWAGWVGRHRHLPPAWWGLWAFALFSNLRYPLTGYTSSYALALALGVLWWLLVDPGPLVPVDRRFSRQRRGSLFLAALALLAAANLSAQYLVSNVYFNAGRAWVQTALGPLAIEERYHDQVVAIQDLVLGHVPQDVAIFSTGPKAAAWYLITQRHNPTPFDLLMVGFGTSGADAQRVQADLERDQPGAIILPASYREEHPSGLADMQDRSAIQQGLARWWETLPSDYMDRTPSSVRDWVVLLRKDLVADR